MCQLVDDQDVDFSALIFVDVLFVLAVAEVYLRSVPEPDLVLNDRAPALRDPACQHRAEALGAFHVVFVQVVPDAPEEIDLEPGNGAAPHKGGDTHQVRFAAAGCAPIQNLGRSSLERRPLPRMKMKVQGVR
jgi:hypothetical protein